MLADINVTCEWLIRSPLASECAFVYNAASFQISVTDHKTMLETSPLRKQIKDLKERTDVLRGYL